MEDEALQKRLQRNIQQQEARQRILKNVKI
jgi:hypothetical protein